MPRVPHLLLEAGWEGPAIELEAGSLRHLKRVLRLEDGRWVTYTDGRGGVGSGLLEGNTVVRGDERKESRPAPSLTMAVAPPRVADRARMVVEKLAELGVDELVWLETERGEGRPPRAERAAAWARAALEQSHGAWLMEIRQGGRPEGPWPEASRVLVCDRGGAPVVSALAADQPILGLVGPEGGFTTGELPSRARSVSLGRPVLRVETAAIALAAIVRARRDVADVTELPE